MKEQSPEKPIEKVAKAQPTQECNSALMSQDIFFLKNKYNLKMYNYIKQAKNRPDLSKSKGEVEQGIQKTYLKQFRSQSSNERQTINERQKMKQFYL